MKLTLLLFLSTLVLLLGFFSPSDYTGNYFRATSGGQSGERGGDYLVSGALPELEGNVGERRLYLVRDRNVEPRWILASIAPSALTERYKFSESARAGIYSLYDGTSRGDVNCDGETTYDDVRILGTAARHIKRNLDPTFSKGFATLLSGPGSISQKYLGSLDIPSSECLERGDMNFDGRIDLQDVKLLYITAEADRSGRGPSYTGYDDYFALDYGVGTADVAGKEIVLQGKKCVYIQIERSPYHRPGNCEDPPAGYKWEQTTKGVKLLPDHEVRLIPS
jgi:hypothetical protein